MSTLNKTILPSNCKTQKELKEYTKNEIIINNKIIIKIITHEGILQLQPNPPLFVPFNPSII